MLSLGFGGLRFPAFPSILWIKFSAVGLIQTSMFPVNIAPRQSLAGTLKAAKKRKILAYGPELLLQGVSDKEVITLNKAA
jgi:hypothetical protein